MLGAFCIYNKHHYMIVNEMGRLSINKKVIQWDLEGNIINTFDNVIKAAESLSLEQAITRAYVLGTTPSNHRGYILAYDDQPFPKERLNTKPKKHSFIGKKIGKFSVMTKELLKTYDSVTDASKNNSLFPSAIAMCLRKNSGKNIDDNILSRAGNFIFLIIDKNVKPKGTNYNANTTFGDYKINYDITERIMLGDLIKEIKTQNNV